MIEEARLLALKEEQEQDQMLCILKQDKASELSSNGHHGVDQVTMEARCYGFAKNSLPSW